MTVTSDNPGITIHAQCPLMIALLASASWRMTPQLSVPTCTSPRNARVLSDRMATATVRIVLANTSGKTWPSCRKRSEEHTSELQSLRHLVCRLLLEKKNRYYTDKTITR